MLSLIFFIETKTIEYQDKVQIMESTKRIYQDKDNLMKAMTVM